jgi:hypothetical protein
VFTALTAVTAPTALTALTAVAALAAQHSAQQLRTALTAQQLRPALTAQQLRTALTAQQLRHVLHCTATTYRYCTHCTATAPCTALRSTCVRRVPTATTSCVTVREPSSAHVIRKQHSLKKKDESESGFAPVDAFWCIRRSVDFYPFNPRSDPLVRLRPLHARCGAGPEYDSQKYEGLPAIT